MYPGVELRLYRYVAVLAQELNFTRAALRLHFVQPSLSNQIRELENDLGAKLFDRTKREIRLTAAGEAFAAEARLVLFHAERAVPRGARGERPTCRTLEHWLFAAD
jgi:LysR family transcriptional regulator, hca operon transcriptional activator